MYDLNVISGLYFRSTSTEGDDKSDYAWSIPISGENARELFKYYETHWEIDVHLLSDMYSEDLELVPFI